MPKHERTSERPETAAPADTLGDLRTSEARYRGIVEEQTELICRFLPDGTLTFVNESYCRYFGKTQEELVGRPIWPLIAEEDREPTREHLAALDRETPVGTIEHRALPPGGDVRWVQWTSRVLLDRDGRPSEFQAVGRDITDRMRAEERLRESEHRHRSLLQSIPHGISEVDTTGVITFANAAYHRLLGYDDGQLIGVHLTDLLADDAERQGLPAALERYARDPHQPAPAITQVRTKDGRVLDVEVDWNHNRDDRGGVTGFISVITDVTERRRAEEALRESEEEYRRLVENMNEGIWVIDAEGRTTFVNLRMAEMLGYGVKEMLGKPLHAFMDERGMEIARRNFERRREGASARNDFEFLRKDGTRLYATMSTSPISDDEGRFLGAMACVTDITERKKAEEEVARLARFPSENPNPVLRVAEDATLLYANKASAPLLELWQCKVGDRLPGQWSRHVAEVLRSAREQYTEVEYGRRVFSFALAPVTDAGYINLYGHEITDRKRAEEALQVSHHVLDIANRQNNLDALLTRFVREIRDLTNCEAVGVQVLGDEDAVAARAYEGFRKSQYAADNPLSLRRDRCLCVDLDGGIEGPPPPHLSEAGSFYTNDATALLAEVPEEKRACRRTHCFLKDYRSVAVVPIRVGDRPLGWIHVADHEPGMVPLATVEVIERAALQLGPAIRRVGAEEERKRLLQELEAERARLAAVLEQMPSGVLIAEAPSGRFILANRQVEHIWRAPLLLNPRGPEALRDHAACHPEGWPCQPGACPILRAIRTGEVVTDEEIDFVRGDGAHGTMLVNCAPVRNHHGTVVAAVMIFSDVTTRKRMQEALRRSHQQLEQRVEERTAELAAANVALQDRIAQHRRSLRELARSRKQMRDLARRTVLAREEERADMAREIHDELGQIFTGLVMDLTWLHGRLAGVASTDPALLDKITTMTEYVRATMETVRRIARKLRPSMLDDLGLAAAIEWQAQEFEQRSGVRCSLDLPADEREVPSGPATAVFRIFQEALTNVARHSGATRVEVRLQVRGRNLTLEVADNGKGIREEEATGRKSLGLLGMQERARACGGQVHIAGTPGKGTRVTVSIPLLQGGTAP